MKKYCVNCDVSLNLFIEANSEEEAEKNAIIYLDSVIASNLAYDEQEHGTIDYCADCVNE